MSISVHLDYTGKNGSARRFAEVMEASGIADATRGDAGNEGYLYQNAPHTDEQFLRK